MLFTGWKHGYLCDSESYGIFSEVTGLTRKQISNWARTQITKQGDKPLPSKSCVPLSSIIDEFAKIRRLNISGTFENVTTYPLLHASFSRSLKRKRSKVRFTEHQRNILFFAQENGFLRNNQNYGSISAKTGLSRKQISNWARTRIHSTKKHQLPQKNPVPFETIFQTLPKNFCSYPPNITTDHNLEVAKEHFSQNIAPSKFLPILSPRTDYRKMDSSAWLETAGTLLMCGSNVAHQPMQSLPPFELCSRNVKRDFEQFRPKIDLKMIKPVLTVALQGINELSDQKVESLAYLTGSNPNDIRDYLLDQGWRIVAAGRGLRYLQAPSSECSSSGLVHSTDEKTTSPSKNSYSENDNANLSSISIRENVLSRFA